MARGIFDFGDQIYWRGARVTDYDYGTGILAGRCDENGETSGKGESIETVAEDFGGAFDYTVGGRSGLCDVFVWGWQGSVLREFGVLLENSY